MAGDITHLLQQFPGGDEIAKNELLELIESQLRMIARRLLRPYHRQGSLREIESFDVLERAFLKVVKIETIGKGDPQPVEWECRAQFFKCLKQTATYYLLDEYRRETRRRKKQLESVDELYRDAGFIERTTSVAEEKELAEQLYEYIEELPPEERAAVLKRFYENGRLEDIAKKLGCSRATAYRTLQSAIAKLKRMFGSDGIDHV